MLELKISQFYFICFFFPQRMKEGVLMDIERQQRKIQNLKMLQEQQELTKAYRRAIAESKEQE